MTDTELDQLHTAIKRQCSRVPSKQAQPYGKAFFAAVRTGTKITAKVAGNHGTYTVSIQLDPQGLTSACSCSIGKHGSCHHCEALAITFVQDPSLFQVVTPKQRKDVRHLTDVQAYQQSVTLETLLSQLKRHHPDSLGRTDRHAYATLGGD